MFVVCVCVCVCLFISDVSVLLDMYIKNKLQVQCDRMRSWVHINSSCHVPLVFPSSLGTIKHGR